MLKIENVQDTIRYLSEKENLKISNAESFIFSIGEQEDFPGQLTIKNFEKKFNWYSFPNYAGNVKVHEDFLEYFSIRIGWDLISTLNLSTTFIKRNIRHIQWDTFSKKAKLTEKVMDELKDKINWRLASFNQEMSESFIEQNKDRVHWLNISLTKKLSNKFIEKYKKKLNMTYVEMKNKDYMFQYMKDL